MSTLSKKVLREMITGGNLKIADDLHSYQRCPARKDLMVKVIAKIIHFNA